MDEQVVMPTEAVAELETLLDELTPQQVDEFAYRVRIGRIDGNAYGGASGDCGCAYGTAYMLQGFSVEQAMEKIDTNREGMFDSTNFWLPLETFVLGILLGDTPETDARSAALYAAVQRYIVTREGD